MAPGGEDVMSVEAKQKMANEEDNHKIVTMETVIHDVDEISTTFEWGTSGALN